MHKFINREQAMKIIDERLPFGTFWLKDGDYFVGIDNTTGDALTEDFSTLEECLAWLANPSDFLEKRWI